MCLKLLLSSGDIRIFRIFSTSVRLVDLNSASKQKKEKHKTTGQIQNPKPQKHAWRNEALVCQVNKYWKMLCIQIFEDFFVVCECINIHMCDVWNNKDVYWEGSWV